MKSDFTKTSDNIARTSEDIIDILFGINTYFNDPPLFMEFFRITEMRDAELKINRRTVGIDR